MCDPGNGSTLDVSLIFQVQLANEALKNVLVYLFAMMFLCLGSSLLDTSKGFDVVVRRVASIPAKDIQTFQPHMEILGFENAFACLSPSLPR